jgi:hypothetical protein
MRARRPFAPGEAGRRIGKVWLSYNDPAWIDDVSCWPLASFTIKDS